MPAFLMFCVILPIYIVLSALGVCELLLAHQNLMALGFTAVSAGLSYWCASKTSEEAYQFVSRVIHR